MVTSWNQYWHRGGRGRDLNVTIIPHWPKYYVFDCIRSVIELVHVSNIGDSTYEAVVRLDVLVGKDKLAITGGLEKYLPSHLPIVETLYDHSLSYVRVSVDKFHFM